MNGLINYIDGIIKQYTAGGSNYANIGFDESESFTQKTSEDLSSYYTKKGYTVNSTYNRDYRLFNFHIEWNK